MKLTDVLNELKEMAYISDLETHELLFVNRALADTFHISSYQGRTCYELLQGRTSPCPFCNNGQLTEDAPYAWEFYNSLIGRLGSLKDMLIEYEGRLVRLELAEDITEEETNNRKLKRALDTEKLTLNCVKSLYTTENPRETISNILKQTGELLNADRAYVVEFQNGVMNNTYEWCAPGVRPQIGLRRNMDLSLIDMWIESFHSGKSAITPDVNVLRDRYPASYEVLAGRDIHSIIASPLIISNELKGYIGVDNPGSEESENFTILDTLCYFFGISLERNRMNEALVRSSYIDTLTGLYNRNRFTKDVEELSAHDAPIAIVYVDINGLKDINDRFGHQYGDQTLKTAAALLTEAFPGALIYRVGGDEFVVLHEGIDEATVQVRVSDIRNRFLLNPVCKGAVGYVWSETCRNLKKEISAADELMYQDKMYYYRKNPLSNRYRYYNDEALRLSERDVLLKELEKGRFEVYLQPKVSFHNQEVIGAEALIRYHGRENRILLPEEFLPSMEDARTICHIDFYVFETACNLIGRWLKRYDRVPPISINFSRFTLMTPNFLENLENIWLKYSFPKEFLEIEVIERIEKFNNETLIDMIERIKKAGFPVCIDDFGTRYSNLALFINADLDILKVDKSIMKNILTNRKSQLLTASLAKICHNLNIQLIVEGVETIEQFHLLKSLGCDGAQGYLISHPIPIPEYEEHFMGY